MTEDMVRMVLDAYSKIAEGKVEEAEKIFEEVREQIINSATFKAIYERLLGLPKEILAYMLAHVLVFSPNSIEMLDAIEIEDTEMLNEISKKSAMFFAKLLFGGGSNGQA